MCANVADKRPLRMNTLANGKCVSSAYTQPATHVYTHTPTQMDTPTVVHTKCCFAWIHMQMCMSLCVCLCVCDAKALYGHDLALQPRQISIILEKYT